MRTNVGRTVWVVMIMLMTTLVQGGPNDKAVQSAPEEATPVSLRQEITDLMLAREAALAAMSEEYKTIPLAERTAFEARSSQLAAEYDRAYLTLLVEYHRLSGNSAEMERAEQMLNALDGVPQEYERVVVPPTGADENANKSGVIHEN